MKPPEKTPQETPQEKLHSELSSALETALGRSLNLEDMAEVSFLTDNVAHVGDDLNDLELLLAVGLPLTVPRAVKEVKDVAKFITEKNGGDGAVREITDMIILSKKQ